MKRNEIYTHGDQIYRILIVKEDNCLVIDCKNNTMPVWEPVTTFWDVSTMTDEDLYTLLDFKPVEDDTISPERKKVMHERYTMIAPVLSFIGDENTRSHVINIIATENNISKQSVRSFLKKYLVIQNIQVLLPKEREYDTALTKDQKNMRWSLNKFFYNFEKNSLRTAYVKMLKEKYCDAEGKLLEEYPSYYQYRYFYRKTRKLENYYISRNGLTNYQRNDRPCVGDNVRVYASAPGLGMVDATVCDIYLVNESGQVVGRPILTACVDAYSGICMGYSLGWEGGVYSIRDMTLNIIEDKEKLCLKHGIHIDETAWPVNKLPGRIISDQGSEYIGYAKQNGYAVQNTVLKMTKKRALVDAALNVGNLSARFTQDVEDMNLEPEQPSVGKSVEELRSNKNSSSAPKSERPASQKQIYFLETLMGQHGTTVDAMNKYVSQQYGIDDYRKISSYQASQLIERFKREANK